jgi:hypothetical protein
MDFYHQDANFHKKYNLLMEDKYKITRIEKEFQTLNSAEENSHLVVISNYYRFIILLFITILLIFVFIRYINAPDNVTTNGYNDLFFIFSVILLYFSFYKIANIYDVCIFISILVIIYIIVKTNMKQ